MSSFSLNFNIYAMKKMIFRVIILLSVLEGTCQSLQKEVQHPDIAGKLFRNQNKTANKPQGSPYLQKMFAPAKVEKINIKAFMRYNVFDDNFEFITPKNDTLILDKIDDFGTIVFAATNKKYKLTQYVDTKNKLFNGYLISLYEKGDFVLYKKENIAFYEEKLAKTTLERDMPAKYVKSDDFYFFKNKEKGTIEFPENKKQLLKLFPDKKEAMETFLKENKINFDEESDKMKIIDFLNTI